MLLIITFTITNVLILDLVHRIKHQKPVSTVEFLNLEYEWGKHEKLPNQVKPSEFFQTNEVNWEIHNYKKISSDPFFPGRQ